MCTVSWIHTQDGYQLLCNRDELDTRMRAAAPRSYEVGGVQCVAPTDGDFGGTWISSNEFGLTVALLNRSGKGARATRSRGSLVRELASARSVEEAQAMVARAWLDSLAGFSLVMLEPGRPAALSEWDGRQLAQMRNAEHRMPLTSSSFDPEGVEASRRAEFASRVQLAHAVSTDVLLEFHQSHGRPANPSAYSTCMHRPGARTVSFTWVDVSASRVSLFYSPAAPCQWEPGETVRLTRKVNELAACG
jgi:hypothetical protein